MKDLVVIAVDDLLNIWHDGDQFGVEIHTPNLDRLSAMGVSFTNAHVTSPVCSPSRAAALSGQSSFTTGVLSNNDAPRWHEDIDLATTLPAVLKAAGYETHGFGKLFHEYTLPDTLIDQTFDTYYSAPISTYRADGARGRYSIGTHHGDESDLGDAITTKAAVDFLLNYDGKAPLSVMVGLKDPHVPLVSTQAYKDLYPVDQIVVPEWSGDEPPRWLREYTQNDLWAEVKSEGWAERYIQAYLANISEMDARIGEVLDGIEASGRDPVIAFWSDHGYMIGDHNLTGKWTPYDQSTWAPLIFVDPDDGAEGRRNDGVVSLVDMMPTILDLIGVDIPESAQGNSLAPNVANPSEATEGVALSTVMGTITMRTARYRVTRYEDGTWELFNVARDPDNADNLANVPRYAQILEKMQAWLINESEAQGVTFYDAAQVVSFDTTWGDLYLFSSDDAEIGAVTDDDGGYDRGYSNNAFVRMPNWMEDFWFKAADSNHEATVFGGSGDNRIIGGGGGGYPKGGDDYLFGRGGADYLSGVVGDDTLRGGRDQDTLSGDAGNDSLIGGANADVIDGGAGTDLVSYRTSQAGVVADLRFPRHNEGDAAGDQFISIENLAGSNRPDELSGDRGANLLVGDGGYDSLEGRFGNDTLVGGNGQDVLNGGGHNDTLIGGPGADVFVFGADFGRDRVLDFRPGVDRLEFFSAVFDRTADVLRAFETLRGNAVLEVGDDTVILVDVRVEDLSRWDILV